MKLTKEFKETLKNSLPLQPQKKDQFWERTVEEQCISTSNTCCGVRELTDLHTVSQGEIAQVVNCVLTKRGWKRNFVIYYAPAKEKSYRAVLDTLLSFGFQSLGIFTNPNTRGKSLEAVYFMNEPIARKKKEVKK